MTTNTFPNVKIQITGSGSKEQLSAALIEMAAEILKLSANEIKEGGTLEDHILCLDYVQEIYDDH